MSHLRFRSSLAPRTSNRATCAHAEPTLDLRRVLLHPAWLGALALLALNDHVLKSSGLLPGALTGKLSDFAGLFLAPALLAVIVGVKTRRAWICAHLLIGLVFAALQLSPFVAAAWSQLFSAFGLGWTTTMDVSDLMACVALVASFHLWTPHALETRSLSAQLARPWRRGATVGVALTGVMVSAATSPPPDFEEFYPDFSAQAYLHNQSDLNLSVLLRPIREEVALDCAAISLDPGALLPESAFASAERWDMPARTAINVWTTWTQRECYAVLVSGDTFPAFIMFWDEEVDSRLIPGELPAGAELPSMGVAVESDANGNVLEVSDTGPELAFVPLAGQVLPSAGCELADEGARLDWVGIPYGNFDVAAVDFGVDGCLRLALQGTTLFEGYICMPYEAFPFRSGDAISISVSDTLLAISDEGVDEFEVRELRLDKGKSDIGSEDFEMAARELNACEFSVDLDCVDVARRAELLVVGEADSATLQPGAAPTILEMPEGRSAEMQLIYGASRAALDGECAAGSNELGADLDLITLIQFVP